MPLVLSVGRSVERGSESSAFAGQVCMCGGLRRRSGHGSRRVSWASASSSYSSNPWRPGRDTMHRSQRTVARGDARQLSTSVGRRKAGLKVQTGERGGQVFAWLPRRGRCWLGEAVGEIGSPTPLWIILACVLAVAVATGRSRERIDLIQGDNNSARIRMSAAEPPQQKTQEFPEKAWF